MSRRRIQIVLGVIWIIDGCFQLQPKMFSNRFISQVINPALSGQPGFLTSPIHWASNIFLSQPVLFNALIAGFQLLIGLLIIYKPTIKIGLYLSIFWGLFVWLFGEAANGLFSGQEMVLTGLPGAALLYSLISLAVLPAKDKAKKLADHWLIFIWSAVWILAAIYELLPAQNSIMKLNMMISGGAAGAPGWLASLDHASVHFLNHLGGSMSMAQMTNFGYLYNLLFALLLLAIGLGVLAGRHYRQLAVVLGIGLSIIFWFIGQGLGGYYTGLATDVQAAPLFILLGLGVINQPDFKLKATYQRLERLLV